MSNYYKVCVNETRTRTFWVKGDTEEAAREDADILSVETNDRDWDDIDTDWEIYPSTSPPPGQIVWTGGPNGTFENT